MPATGAVGSPGKSVSNESPFNYGASPDSLAAASIGSAQGPNFFTGVANNAPGGAYGATQQATDQANSANQLIQPGQPGIGSAAQNLYNPTPILAPGFNGYLYQNSAPVVTPGPGLAPEQQQAIDAQTALFNSNIGPTAAPLPFNGVSTAPSTVRPQPPAPAPKAQPAPAPSTRCRDELQRDTCPYIIYHMSINLRPILFSCLTNLSIFAHFDIYCR
jgi:hypothetical protein